MNLAPLLRPFCANMPPQKNASLSAPFLHRICSDFSTISLRITARFPRSHVQKIGRFPWRFCGVSVTCSGSIPATAAASKFPHFHRTDVGTTPGCTSATCSAVGRAAFPRPAGSRWSSRTHTARPHDPRQSMRIVSAPVPAPPGRCAGWHIPCNKNLHQYHNAGRT